jgi:hypothetical protein
VVSGGAERHRNLALKRLIDHHQHKSIQEGAQNVDELAAFELVTALGDPALALQIAIVQIRSQCLAPLSCGVAIPDRSQRMLEL